jgi:antitoxin YefM
MQSVYRIKAKDLDDRFLESLKALWGDREIEIVVSEADETAYLMGNEANRQHLLKAIDDGENRHNLVGLDLVESEQPSALKLAALSAITDYTPGSEILAFEAIDGEDFQEFEAV